MAKFHPALMFAVFCGFTGAVVIFFEKDGSGLVMIVVGIALALKTLFWPKRDPNT